jgi:uncharacterized damage-inducible protein DinB
MKFSIAYSISVLERTPNILKEMLDGLQDEWIFNNEGKDTWSPYDVMGHLIHGEKTDWIPRMEIILSDKADKKFVPFDRFAMMNAEKKPLNELLEEFKTLREQNLEILSSKKLSEKDLLKTGIHPEFGEVTLKQLLGTWVAHDLGHIAQISRVMAKQYKEEAGPWVKYLRVLQG